MDINRFYLVKDGKPACSFIYSGEPYSIGIYDEPEEAVPVKNIPDRHLQPVGKKMFEVFEKTGARPKNVLEENKTAGPKIYIGRSYIDLNPALMGEMTSYQYAIKFDGENLWTLSHTPGGYFDAINKLLNSVVISDDNKDAWIPLDVVGIYDRNLPEVTHAFDKFTISYHGNPYRNVPLDDEVTYQGIVDFGTDEACLGCYDIDNPESVKKVRDLINRLYQQGITTRLYGVHAGGSCNPFVDVERIDGEIERIKRFIELFGDLDGISEWGFYDEPEPDAFMYCSCIKSTFKKYDPKKRPVYINLGPRVHSYGYPNFYEEYSRIVRPDYYCFDRYPYFLTERGAEMTDKYFYSNFEIERAKAIDDSVDHGAILAGIKVGGDPDSDRADITPHFMRWQTNLLAAYGARYIEYYVYYHVHDYCILDENNKPTWRWDLCVEATKYLKAVFSLLDNLRLEAVFHLENSDGGYDIDVIPYYGYRGVGEVKGNDAILSFYEDGVLVLTDKHADEFDGGDHAITLTGFAAKEWFNPETRAWEAAANCPAAKIGEDGLTVNFTLASQYIFR